MGPCKPRKRPSYGKAPAADQKVSSLKYMYIVYKEGNTDRKKVCKLQILFKISKSVIITWHEISSSVDNTCTNNSSHESQQSLIHTIIVQDETKLLEDVKVTARRLSDQMVCHVDKC